MAGGLHCTWVQYGHASPSSWGSGYTVSKAGRVPPSFLPLPALPQWNSFVQNMGAIPLLVLLLSLSYWLTGVPRFLLLMAGIETPSCLRSHPQRCEP